jgi:hypothetical protein
MKMQAAQILRGSTLVAIAALTVFPGPAGSAVAQGASRPAVVAPPAIELEPKALNIIEAACRKLAAAKSMSFTGVVSEESASRLGPPLVYTSRYEVTLQRPDKLRIVSPGDGPPTELYYDGKQLAAFAPRENYIARADAPPTIDGALEMAFTKAQIYYPFSDLIVADPYKDLSEGLRVAFYVGQSESVGGTTTDIVAYANDHVFVQAWIGAKDHLPRRLRAVYRKDPGGLRHEMTITDWTLDAPVAASTFAVPDAATKALPIPFASPQPAPVAAK